MSLKSGRRLSDLEEQRKKKADGEEKLPDKNRVHSFILDLELGTEERQRTVGKAVRKDSHSKEKERKDKEKEKERSGAPDERLKHKLRKTGDAAGDTEKDGGAARGGAADEKKGAKVKPDRKSSVSSREIKTEAADEGNLKKGKTAVGEKEKSKVSGKSLRRLDSTGSSEERSEVETGSEVSRKKDKHPKEILKRSKSHPEAKPGEKLKVRSDRKDSSADKTQPQKSISENESDVRKVEAGPKVKSLSEKHKSKSQNPAAGKSDKKSETKTKAGSTEQKKEERKTSEEKAKVAKKTTEKKVPKDSERKSGDKESSAALEPTAVSSTTPLPDDPYGALSDVTPESEDEDAVVKEPRPLSAEADALLSLMDVCTSASELAARQETEADMKMKEAALTLLSMDPDIARSSDLISDSQVAMETLPTGTGSALYYPVTETNSESASGSSSQDAGSVSSTIIDCCNDLTLNYHEILHFTHFHCTVFDAA